MDITKRKSVSESLKVFCPCMDDSHYISVTEWDNTDGWDIDLDGKLFQLTIEELEAINYLTAVIRYKDVSDS